MSLEKIVKSENITSPQLNLPSANPSNSKILKNKFEKLTQEWKAHCEKVGYTTQVTKYLESEAFEKLTQLGTQIFPYIQEMCSKDNRNRYIAQNGWTYLIEEIIDERIIKGSLNHDLESIRENTYNWLKENMSKYQSPK